MRDASSTAATVWDTASACFSVPADCWCIVAEILSTRNGEMIDRFLNGLEQPCPFFVGLFAAGDVLQRGDVKFLAGKLHLGDAERDRHVPALLVHAVSLALVVVPSDPGPIAAGCLMRACPLVWKAGTILVIFWPLISDSRYFSSDSAEAFNDRICSLGVDRQDPIGGRIENGLSPSSPGRSTAASPFAGSRPSC